MTDSVEKHEEKSYMLAPEVKKAFKQLKITKKYRLIELKIDTNDGLIRLNQCFDRGTSVEEAIEVFKDDECAYVIWDVDVELDQGGIEKPNLYLITWCPGYVKSVNLRPLYASNISKVRNIAVGAQEIYATNFATIQESVGINTIRKDDEEELEIDDNWMDV